jgi:hypothetical protein
MPGGSFKKWAKPWSEESRSLLYGTYKLSKKRIVSFVLPSFDRVAIVILKFVLGGRDCHSVIHL